ncbi:hypothetical protein [Paenibacillus sp. CECT 9249]|nr:hypothetical protein [Paenibacillus sp. CECT 9249]
MKPTKRSRFRLLCGRMFYKSYEIYEKEHRIIQQYWGGFVRHNEICRIVRKAKRWRTSGLRRTTL